MILATSHLMTLYYDNSEIVANLKEPRCHKIAKHIEMKYYLIRNIIEWGKVIVYKLASKENLANLFTKALSAKSLEGHLVD